MDSVINFAILKHPINWVIVTLMVLIALFGLHQIALLGATKKDT